MTTPLAHGFHGIHTLVWCAAVLAALHVGRAPARAQSVRIDAREPAMTAATERVPTAHLDIRSTLKEISLVLEPTSVLQAPAVATTSPKDTPLYKQVVFGVLGGVGGFFIGGWTGGELDRHVLHPNCGCDDPGLGGFIVGSITGAIGGAILAITFGS